MISFWLPSGKLTVCDIENDHLEIVDLPMKNGDFPEQNVSYVNVYQRVSCTILYHLSRPSGELTSQLKMAIYSGFSY